MVDVVNKEPHESVIQEVVCQKCGVTLRYVPLEVKEDYTSDYTGGKDYFKYIDCPNCKNRARV